MHLANCALGARLPGLLKGDGVAHRVEGPEEGAVGLDRLGDEVVDGRHEHRPALGVVGVEQLRVAPALQHGSDLPAEVARVLKSGVHTVAAIRRVAVRCVAGDEDAARAVGIGDGKSQVPESDVVELNFERGADGFVQIGPEVEVVGRRARRHWRVKEPSVAQVNPAEKLPVALERRLQHVVVRLSGIALEKHMQFLRAKHQQHHHAVVVGAGLRQARLLAHQRPGAVATDDVGGADHALFSTRCAELVAVGPHLHRGCYAVFVLRDGGGVPAVHRLQRRQLRRTLAQHSFGRVLRQALVGGVVVVLDEIALQPVMHVRAQQRAVGREPADAVLRRDRARGAQALFGPPEMEVLHRALGQVLALRDRLGLRMAFDHDAAHATLSKLDRQAHADRPCADDEDLCIMSGRFSRGVHGGGGGGGAVGGSGGAGAGVVHVKAQAAIYSDLMIGQNWSRVWAIDQTECGDGMW